MAGLETWYVRGERVIGMLQLEWPGYRSFWLSDARLNLLDGFCSHRPEERHTFSFTYHGESSDKQYTAHQFATDNHEGHNARSTYAATVGSLEASASPDKQNVVVFMHVPCVSTGSERLTSLGNVFRHQSGLGSFLASRLQARIRFTMTGSATEHLGTFRRPQARCFGRRYIKLKIPSRHYRGSGRSAVLDKGLQYSCLVTKTDGSERLRRPGIGRYIGQPGPYLKLVALWLLSVSSRNITSCSYGIGSRSYRVRHGTRLITVIAESSPQREFEHGCPWAFWC
nr:hypothetical protein CFP56_30910 [Quercus suber]